MGSMGMLGSFTPTMAWTLDTILTTELSPHSIGTNLAALSVVQSRRTSSISLPTMKARGKQLHRPNNLHCLPQQRGPEISRRYWERKLGLIIWEGRSSPEKSTIRLARAESPVEGLIPSPRGL